MAVQWVGLWRRGGGRTTGRFGGMTKVYQIDSKNEDGAERFLCGLGEDDSAVHVDLLCHRFSRTGNKPRRRRWSRPVTSTHQGP
jgi:hypothetical protein